MHAVARAQGTFLQWQHFTEKRCAVPKHQMCSSSRCARSSPAALAQVLPDAKVQHPHAAHAALAGSSCFFFHSVSIAESARPCTVQRCAVSTVALPRTRTESASLGCARNVPSGLPGTAAASSSTANALNKPMHAHRRIAAPAAGSQAHHCAHAASQRKGAEAVGVHAVGVQVPHVDLYTRVVLGCDQLVSPRAARSRPSFPLAQRACVDGEVACTVPCTAPL